MYTPVYASLHHSGYTMPTSRLYHGQHAGVQGGSEEALGSVLEKVKGKE